MPQLAQSLEVQVKLKEEYPFTRPKTPHKRPPRRETVRSKLRCAMELSDADLKFMSDHPEDVEWLKDHVESRFSLKFEEALANYQLRNTGGEQE